MSITPPAGLNPAALGAAEGKRNLPRWVGPCVLIFGAGVLWAYRRRSCRQVTNVAALDPARLQVLREAVRLARRLRGEGRPLTSAETLRAVPEIVRVGALLAQWRSSLDADVESAASSGVTQPGTPGADDDVFRSSSHGEALGELASEQWSLLSGLAQQLGVAGSSFDRVLHHQIYAGEIESFRVARDRAIDCLTAFCAAHSQPLPRGVSRAFSQAIVLPHAASNKDPVCLETVGRVFARQPVLAYQPHMLDEWSAPGHPAEPNAISLFRSIAMPGECRPKCVTGLVSAPMVKTRAVLRAMVQQLTQNAVRSTWGRPGAEDALVDRLALTLAPVWGAMPSRAVRVDALVSAVSRLLMDLVWGEHVPTCYEDRWALAQCVSQAVAKLPDPHCALRAWFQNDLRALDELGRCVLLEARQLRDSWLRAWSAGS